MTCPRCLYTLCVCDVIPKRFTASDAAVGIVFAIALVTGLLLVFL